MEHRKCVFVGGKCGSERGWHSGRRVRQWEGGEAVGGW